MPARGGVLRCAPHFGRVYKAFRSIAGMSGNKSQDRKVQAIKKLIVSCKEDEARYVIRGLQGKLRIGLAESSVIVALAHAVTITPPGPLPLAVLDTRRKLGGHGSAQELEEAVLELKRVYSELPSLDVIVPKILEHGLKGLHKVRGCVPGGRGELALRPSPPRPSC